MNATVNPLFTSSPKKAEDVDPDEVLKSVLSSNKLLSRIYPEGSAKVIYAPEDRAKLAGRRQLEFWPTGEEGTKEFPRPSGYDKQTLLEIYNPEIRGNRNKLSSAVYGDLLHGLDNDPNYSKLKQAFVGSYLPNIRKFHESLRAKGQSQKSIDDMYIRGYLSPDERDEFRKGQHYSPRQLEILEKMKRYIATGVPER